MYLRFRVNNWLLLYNWGFFNIDNLLNRLLDIGYFWLYRLLSWNYINFFLIVSFLDVATSTDERWLLVDIVSHGYLLLFLSSKSFLRFDFIGSELSSAKNVLFRRNQCLASFYLSTFMGAIESLIMV
jgi:hypothetical protein